MVFFSCDGCGEMLKKTSVDAHARRCRNCESVSCVDCSVSFWGDDYRAHTSCITEAERYEKTVYRGPRKNETNRKLTPQERWMETIREALDTSPPAIKNYLKRIVELENVPRKQKQFRNFAMNSLRLHGTNGDSVLTAVWKHIDGVKQKAVSRQAKEKEEEEAKAEAKKLESERLKVENAKNEEGDDVGTKSKTVVDPKTMKKTMVKALKKAPNRQLKMKELRKILAKITPADKSAIKALMLQVLKDNSKKMSVEKKTVTLVEK